MSFPGATYHRRLARAHRAFHIVRLQMMALILFVVMGFVGTIALAMVTLAISNAESQSRFVAAQQLLRQRVQSYEPHLEALELAVANAGALLTNVRAVDVPPIFGDDLEFSIWDARAAHQQTTAELAQAQQVQHNDVVLAGQWWTTLWQRDALSQQLAEIDLPEQSRLATLVSALGQSMQKAQSALDGWSSEQERIAAEKAAADAALSRTRTRPVTPAAPTGAAAVPVRGFDAQAYLAAIAPNSFVVWDSGVCSRLFGASTYLCGFATLNLASSVSSPVPITLDSSLVERYANSVGISVLVHEAAHARQWLKYGRSVTTAWTTSTGLTGRDAIEYMAECATIVKLGYGTGTYIPRGSTCSARDQAEAATYWR